MKLITLYKWHVLWAAVFAIFIFFRFWNITYRIPFTWDHEQFSVQVRQIVVEHKFTLLGPRVTDDRGFFLAPYFTYMLIPFYLLTHLHPFALIYFLAVLNLVFFLISARVITHIYNQKVALLYLLFWSINPLLVEYDTNPWWPVMIPLGTMIVLYLLYLIYEQKRFIHYVFLGISVGFFCNMHFQFVFIGIFAAVFLLTTYKNSLQNQWLKIIGAFSAFCFMFTPLVLFDLRHDSLNFKLFTTYFSERVLDDLPYPYAWQPVFANFIYPLLHSANSFTPSLFLLCLSGIVMYLMSKKKGFQRIFYISFLCLIVITVFGFSLYGRRPSEYYFVYLYPFIYLTIADFLLDINKYKILAGIIILLVLINFNDLIKTLHENSGGMFYKDRAVKALLPYAVNKQVQVSLDMPLGTNNGYMYLVEQNGVIVSKDPKDPLIELRIPPRKGDIVVKNIGVHIPQELK